MRLVFLLSTSYPAFSLHKIHTATSLRLLPYPPRIITPPLDPVLGALPFHFELMYDVEYADVVPLIMYVVLLTVQHLWLYT
jgi:hypothetical protein